MIARVATFNHLDPEDLDPDAIERLRGILRSTPGYVAGYHIRNPESGKAFSIAIYESADSIRAAREALAARPTDQRVGIDPDEVEFCTEVYEF
jgi:hypothetical protein